MTTRADIRTRARDELNDNGSVKVWSDALLNRWIGEGIREWSRVVPRDRPWQTTSTANDPSYVLPSDVLEVVRVEHPPGMFRVRGGLRTAAGQAPEAGAGVPDRTRRGSEVDLRLSPDDQADPQPGAGLRAAGGRCGGQYREVPLGGRGTSVICAR